MSAIFISHSSKDNAIAGEVKGKLAEQGHRSVFLDFDPAEGIPAGRNWELELYARLRSCQAVIVLCSEHSMISPWCFAEITQARALGKHLFPVKIALCGISPLLNDVQVIDLTQNLTEGYHRLWSGLKKVGLDPADLFDWDGTRSPYPGLLAFQEQDAVVYFGRDAIIQRTMETLNLLQRLGSSRLAVVLGSSGSGKSSLVRAGIIPRLKRDKDRWLVLTPFRPMVLPFDRLAMVLAGAFAAFGNSRDWKSIRDALNPAPDTTNHLLLLELADDLRVLAGRHEATVIIVVDQFEELLGRDNDHFSTLFLHLLKTILDQPKSPFLALFTLRSDFLGAFQNHETLQDLKYEPIHLPQMALVNFMQVIEGPAKVAGVMLETGLAQAMVADTATDDALPLLAFTLRELWDRYSTKGRLTLEDYRDSLGGLKGSVARVAETVCNDLSPEQERHLRKAFLSMVRVDDEGRYIRKPARWAELPKEVYDLLERFVQARLLISRGEGIERILEVAHEALFRSWDRLSAWLNLDREFLLWRQRLHREITDWARIGYDDSMLLHGPVLAEAKRWLSERESELSSAEHNFVQKSDERKKNQQQWIQRRKLAAIIFISGVLILIIWQKHQAELAKDTAQQLTIQARADELAIRASSLVNISGNMVLAGMLTAESLNFAHTLEGQQILAKILALTPRQVQPIGLEGQNIILSPANRLLLNWPNRSEKPANGSVSLFDRDTMKTLKTWQLEGAVWPAFDPNGKMMAIAGHARRLLVIDLNTRETLLNDYYPSLIDAEFSSDGRRLYVVRADGVLEIRTSPDWRIEQEIRFATSKVAFYRIVLSVAKENGPVMIHSPLATYVLTKADKKPSLLQTMKQGEFVSYSAMDQNGQRVFSATRKDWQDTATLWNTKTRQAIARLEYESRVNVAIFSPDGSRLAVGTEAGGIYLWDAPSGKKLASFTVEKSVNTLAFSADGSLLATGDDNGDTLLWDIKALKDAPVWNLESSEPVEEVFFAEDGRSLLIADQAKILRRVAIATGKELSKNRISGQILAIAGVQSSPMLAVSARESEDNEAWADLQARDAATGQSKWSIAHNGHFRELEFNPDARTFATSTYGTDEIKIWDADTGKLLHSPPITGWELDYTADGSRLVVEGKNISVIDPRSGELIGTIGEPGGVSHAVYPGRDGSLITYGQDDDFRAWNVKTGKALWRRGSPFPDGFDTQLSPDGHSFALRSGENGRLRIFDTASGHQLSEIPASGTEKGYDRLIFSPDGNRLLRLLGPLYHRKNTSQDQQSPLSTTDQERIPYFQVELWDPTSGNMISTKQITGSSYINFTFLSGGELVVAPENNDKANLEILDSRNGKLLWKIPAYKNYIYSQHYEPGDSGIFKLQGPDAPVLFGGPKFTELRDPKTGRLLARHDRPISRTNVIQDASWVISLYFDIEQSGHRAGCSASLWNWKSGQERWRKRWSNSEECGFGDAAVSLDGRQLLLRAHGAGGEMIALDLQNGKLVGAIKTGSIQTFWPLPDSDQVLTFDFNGSVRAWRWSTGKEIHSFAHGRSADGVAIAARAKRAVTYANNLLRVWNLEDLSLVANHQSDSTVREVSFRSDGQQIAYTSGEDNGSGTALNIWNVADRIAKTIPVESGSIANLGYDSTGTRLKATVSKRGRVWSASSLQPMLTVEPLMVSNTLSLSFSSDGTRLQVGGHGGLRSGFRIWDINSSREIARLDGNDIQEIPNTNDFLIRDNWGWQRWNIESGDFEKLTPESPRWISQANPGSNLLAGYLSGEQFLTLDVKSGSSRFYQLMPATEELIAHTFATRHDLVIFSQRKQDPYRPGAISLRRLSDGGEEKSSHPDAVVTELKFADGDDSIILLGSPGHWAFHGEGTSLYLWRWRSDKLVPLSEKQLIDSVAVSPNGRLFVTSEKNTSEMIPGYKKKGKIQLRIWDARTGKVIKRLERKRPARALAFSADGRYLAAAEADAIVLFDTDSWSPIRTIQPMGGWIGNQVSFAIGKRIIATVEQSHPSGEGNKGIGVWSMDGTLERVLETTGNVEYYALSSDGKTVAVKANNLSIFDIESGTELVRHSFADLRSIAFGGDNNDLFAAVGQTQESLIKIPWRTQDLIGEVCRRIQRRLTEREQKQYLGGIKPSACDSISIR